MHSIKIHSPANNIAFLFLFFCSLFPLLSKAQTIPENQLVLPSKIFTIPFCWQGDSINGQWEPHTALLLPVKLNNCPKLFYMQFDLGHPYSIFYKNKLNAIRDRYPASVPVIDSAKLKNFAFKIGKQLISAREIGVQQFDSTGITWTEKNGIEIIGTIGTDLIDGNTVIMDYPNQKISISASVPKKYAKKITLTPFIYARRSILLPAKIQSKQTMLYFDTGSSMYELLTDKKTAEILSIPGTPLMQSKVRSWNRYLTANTLAAAASIEINGQTIPLHSSTYMEGMSNAQVEGMMKMGIGGMTGNKLFLQHILVLDTKNQRFGLMHKR